MRDIAISLVHLTKLLIPLLIQLHFSPIYIVNNEGDLKEQPNDRNILSTKLANRTIENGRNTIYLNNY